MFINLELKSVIDFAVEKHNDSVPEKRFRKSSLGGTKLPYIFHPFEVATMVWKWGAGTNAVMKAALCHDILEDCNCTYEELEYNIGKQSATIVQELSFFENQGMTKEEYMASFANKSIESLVIKVADRICNTLDFALTDPKYAVKYWEKAANLLNTYETRSKEVWSEFFERFHTEGQMPFSPVVNSMDSAILRVKNQASLWGLEFKFY